MDSIGNSLTQVHYEIDTCIKNANNDFQSNIKKIEKDVNKFFEVVFDPFRF